jgi:5-methylcytosine-specific restriction protein A
MPISVKACAKVGCGGLVREAGRSYCEDCSHLEKANARSNHKAYNRNRPDSHKFYGTAAWKLLAKLQLGRNPMCCDPFGDHKAANIRARAKIADHIIPRMIGGPDSLDNLQSLCPTCDRKKQHKERL